MEPVVVVVPILLESRSEPGGAVGAVKPVSPPRNVTVCVAPVGFEIVTVEEKRSACAGVPGEFEFADPPCITTPSTRVVEAATHGVPDAAEQMVVPLAVNNTPADAANGQSSGAVDKTAAAKNVLVILAPFGKKLQTCDISQQGTCQTILYVLNQCDRKIRIWRRRPSCKKNRRPQLADVLALIFLF